MTEIQEKLINYFKKDDLKDSINDLEEILLLLKDNNIQESIVGLIANIVVSNDNIDKKEIIELIKSNNIENLYNKIYELPYKHIPEIDSNILLTDDAWEDIWKI